MKQQRDPVENQKVFANVPYGTVFCITEADTYTDFDTTIAISNENPTVTTSRLTTGNVTVDSDVVTITYTNTRNKQPIKKFSNTRLVLLLKILWLTQ